MTFWDTLGKILFGVLVGLIFWGFASARLDKQAVDSGVLVYDGKAYYVTPLQEGCQ